MIKKVNENNQFKKNTYNKKISIFFVCLVLLIGTIITTGIMLFGNKNEDINLSKTIAYFYDGEKHDAPPAKEEYVIDVIHCDKAVGEWDNEKWNLTLKEIEGKTTCVLNYKKRFSIHTLDIDPNGGKYNGSTGLSQIEIKETKTVELSQPTRKGYTFSGWTVDNESSKVSGNVFAMGDQNTKITANWTVNTYQIEIRESNTCDGTKSGNYNQRIALCAPEKEGYTFIGWETTSGTIEGNALVLDDSNAIVTAKWTANDYDYIVVHKQEALSGAYTIVDTETHNAAIGTTVRPDTKTYTGFTSPEKHSLTISANSSNNILQYLYTRNSYTLTINPGEGETSTQLEQELKYEQSIEIQNPTRRGYNFTGWTKTSGTLQDNIFTMESSNATLTANYQAKSMALQFDANQGTVSPTSKTVTYDQPYGTLPTPVREGYVFDGWYVAGNKIESTTTVNIVEATSAVAHWTKGSYILTINPEVGLYNNSTSTVTQGMEFEDEVTISDPVREGYTFAGWTVTGTGATYNSTTKKFKMGTSNASLTAKWNINKYTLTIEDTYTCDGTQYLDYNSTYELCTPQREGHTFTGWEDVDSIIQNNIVTIKAKNSTVKANWVANSYNYIVYHNKMNLDGETYTTVDADTYTASADFGTVVVTEPKVYAGFKTQEAKSITIGVSNNTVNYNYERNKYTLTINPNGGTYSGQTTQQLYFEQQTTISNPTKEGYNFSSWSMSGNSTLTNKVLTMGTENTTLTANYTAKTFTVTFNPNQGSVTTTSKTVTYDQPYGELPTPVRTYTTFEGWYTDPDNGTKVISTDIVKITSSQTLYAHWDDDYAVFDKGENVNKLMKQLAGGSNVYLTAENTNISSIERSTTLSNTSNNISVEGKPIYIWFDNGKIKWYSEASKVFLNTDASYMFACFSGLTGINLSQYNSSKVTNMSSLFYGDKNITSLNLSPLDTSNVIYMNDMFGNCSSLTSIDLSPLNTSNVVGMSGMFDGMTNLRSINLLPLDTSKVINMNDMFRNCSSLTSIDLSPLNTSNVISMNGIFENMSGITSINLSPLDTSNVVDMTRMFRGMTGLTSLDLSPLNTNNVQYMSEMFSGLAGLTSINLSPLNTSNVIQMAQMFNGMSGLTSIDLRPLDTSMVTNMTGMFSGMSNLTSINLSGFNTSNATTTNHMFYSDGKLTSIDLSSFNTSNVTNMGSCNYSFDFLSGGSAGGWAGNCGMFAGMTSLTSLDLSNFDTSSVTNMGGLFSWDENLANLYIRSFNTQNVTDMHGMFYDMKSITNLDLTNFNTENVTNMGWDSLTISGNSMTIGGGTGMFTNMDNLTTLDISSFDTSNVTNMKGMFMNCPNLTTIYASDKWSVASVTEDTGMFYRDTSLRGGSGTTYSASYVDKTRARIDAGSSGRGYFTYKAAPSN